MIIWPNSEFCYLSFFSELSEKFVMVIFCIPYKYSILDQDILAWFIKVLKKDVIVIDQVFAHYHS